MLRIDNLLLEIEYDLMRTFLDYKSTLRLLIEIVYYFIDDLRPIDPYGDYVYFWRWSHHFRRRWAVKWQS